MQANIHQHCFEIQRCNQRGGRMLSIVDLIDAGTFSKTLAAYSLAAIRKGASFMVGAVPGGAGKTTIMGALLNFVPRDATLGVADGPDTIESGLQNPAPPKRCFVCHEIGNGPYYAYLWGDPLRRYFELPTAGHMIATNLHADAYEQTQDQVCGDNGVSPEAFRRANLLYFLKMEYYGLDHTRLITEVWESDGQSPHQRVYAWDQPELLRSAGLASPGEREEALSDIQDLMKSGARTIEDVRRFLLQRAAPSSYPLS